VSGARRACPTQPRSWLKNRWSHLLSHPGLGQRALAPSCAGNVGGAVSISANGVWRVLRRHGLNTRDRRLRLVAGYAAPSLPPRPEPQPERHFEVSQPGEIVQIDCFYFGRLNGTKGA